MNDSLSEIMGGEKHGSVRMFGFGVCPSDVWKDKSTWKRSQNKYVAALESKVDDLESQLMLNNQKNGNVISTVHTLDRGDIATSSNLDINASTSLNKEIRHQLWFSSPAYDTLVIEVGETINIKSVTNELETIAIGIVCSKDSSKKVGGEELGSFFFFSEVIVKVPIKPNELLIKPYRCIKTIRDAVGASIAWPTSFVVSSI
ncbi:hypothetical protein F8388_010804 [Cannabis sativa]|uniref:Transposase Tnp1/En/Spm-like domain-containing protein n=1 Tax=Cannabis sativa TaxID=3483 RepID=A0A7J6HD21_CANSA|nr:hypothetical protein F8388_010804 [Cannabis sativa]